MQVSRSVASSHKVNWRK